MHPNLRMTPGQLIPEARTMQNASRGPKAKENVNQNLPKSLQLKHGWSIRAHWLVA